jgi:hypothetical protein
MALYECLFFAGDRVTYWENIECQTLGELTAALRDRIEEEKSRNAQAWYRDILVCEVRADRENRRGATRHSRLMSALDPGCVKRPFFM